MTSTSSKSVLLGASALALLAGWGLASGDWLIPGLSGAIALTLIAFRASPAAPVPTILAALFFGYLVGNRGFAQLSPLASLPLFPAEIGLVASVALIAWEAARQRVPLATQEPLDLLVGLWLGYGTIRLIPCLRDYGFMAARDYAITYYALFYFVTRFADREWGVAPLLDKAVRWGAAVMLPLHTLFEAYPDFFLNVFTFRGVPLIYYKGDLAGTFFAIGALAWYFHHEKTGRKPLPLLLSIALVGAVFLTRNRASLLGLMLVVGLMAVRGHLRLLRALLLSGVAVLIATTLWVETGRNRWEDTPLPGVADRLASMVDFEGRVNADADSKGDNNRFRTIWWRTVFEDTLSGGPWLGLGFGADLTTHFLQVYYPDSTDDFSARSPHSFPLTVFARTGVAGTVLLLAIAGWLVWQTVKALGRPQDFGTPLPFAGALVLFASSCFGVVLEGPMGAVVFWSFLGLAANHAKSQESLDNPARPD